MSDLPEGWDEERIKKMCNIVSGSTPRTDNSVYWGGDIFWITPKDLSGYNKKYISETKRTITKEGYASCSTAILPKNSVLMSSRAPIGYLVINEVPMCTNQGFKSFVIKDKFQLNEEFLFYQLKYIVDRIKKEGSGTTFNEISKTKAENIKVKFPKSIQEQKLIVAEIEKQFTRLDSAVKSLREIKKKLEVYRKSVLKAAFEGKLTNKNFKIGELPSGWAIKKIGDILKIVSGNTPKGINELKNEGNILFFKVSDMNTKGNEVYMKTSKISLTEKEIKKLKLKLFPKGTVIFPKRGGAILTNKKRILTQESSFDLNLMGIIPNESVDYLYLYYWLLRLDLSRIYDGSNVPQINNKNIEPLEFILPSLKEQIQIISEIESRFSVIDKIEKTVDAALIKSEQLRKSILKSAFEGKLVKYEGGNRNE